MNRLWEKWFFLVVEKLLFVQKTWNKCTLKIAKKEKPTQHTNRLCSQSYRTKKKHDTQLLTK